MKDTKSRDSKIALTAFLLVFAVLVGIFGKAIWRDISRNANLYNAPTDGRLSGLEVRYRDGTPITIARIDNEEWYADGGTTVVHFDDKIMHLLQCAQATGRDEVVFYRGQYPQIKVEDLGEQYIRPWIKKRIVKVSIIGDVGSGFHG
jgi:hypothetical protein